jgi:hypothetical protein
MSGRSIFLCLKLHFILKISLWGIGNFTCKLRFEKNLKVVIRSKQWCVGDFSWNLGRRWFLILASEAIWNWPLISLISFCFFSCKMIKDREAKLLWKEQVHRASDCTAGGTSQGPSHGCPEHQMARKRKTASLLSFDLCLWCGLQELICLHSILSDKLKTARGSIVGVHMWMPNISRSL